MEELVDLVPEKLLQAVGYYGTAAGAAARYGELSAGLDETIVRRSPSPRALTPRRSLRPSMR